MSGDKIGWFIVKFIVISIAAFFLLLLVLWFILQRTAAGQDMEKGSVTLSWDANREPDLAGYKVYYGLTRRGYSHEIDVGKSTSKQICDLTINRRWYFAVTAYDAAGNESRFSDEVSLYLGEGEIIVGDKLCCNFPNPFNPEKEWTNIRYYLDTAGTVSLNKTSDERKKSPSAVPTRWVGTSGAVRTKS